MNLKDLYYGTKNGCIQFDLSSYEENDGKLSVFEPNSFFGFNIERMLCIYNVPKAASRANHACMNSAFIFIALNGSVRLSVEYNRIKTEYLLNKKERALYVPKASWITAYEFNDNAILLGLSDLEYKKCKYIDDYEVYKSLVENMYVI